jgi:hypothetical protein
LYRRHGSPSLRGAARDAAARGAADAAITYLKRATDEPPSRDELAPSCMSLVWRKPPRGRLNAHPNGPRARETGFSEGHLAHVRRALAS